MVPLRSGGSKRMAWKTVGEGVLQCSIALEMVPLRASGGSKRMAWKTVGEGVLRRLPLWAVAPSAWLGRGAGLYGIWFPKRMLPSQSAPQTM